MKVVRLAKCEPSNQKGIDPQRRASESKEYDVTRKGGVGEPVRLFGVYTCFRGFFERDYRDADRHSRA